MYTVLDVRMHCGRRAGREETMTRKGVRYTEGRKEGRKHGRKEARKRGMKEGKKEGAKERRKERKRGGRKVRSKERVDN